MKAHPPLPTLMVSDAPYVLPSQFPTQIDDSILLEAAITRIEGCGCRRMAIDAAEALQE